MAKFRIPIQRMAINTGYIEVEAENVDQAMFIAEDFFSEGGGEMSVVWDPPSDIDWDSEIAEINPDFVERQGVVTQRQVMADDRCDMCGAHVGDKHRAPCREG